MATQELCDRSERAPMNRAGTMLSEPLQMLFRPISFMGEKIILRIGPVIRHHHAIARDFGHDRRGGN
jgi:hypothetical protein